MRSVRRSAISCSSALVLLGAAIGCRDEGADPTGPTAMQAGLAATAVAPLLFRQVSTGDDHTCGVTTADQAYCWGYNGFSGHGGQLGDGTTTRRLKPVAVLGGKLFSQISAGVNHTCGVTTDNRAFCWGRNDYGQLGDGTTETRLTPVPVAGGRRFRVISAGNFHTCAITPGDVLFCWGTDRYGVLGNNGPGLSLTPARVAGGHTWRNVSAGFSHTCGATTSNAAYCWGNNTNYQIGNGTASSGYPTPTAVAGGLSFRQVFVGSGFIVDASSNSAPDHALSCGITTTDRVYCWGSGGGSSTPRQVIGERRYTQIGVGGQGCGVRFTGVIDCWTSESIERVASGTLRFLRVSVSGIGAHQCAVGTTTRHTAGEATTRDSSELERRAPPPRPSRWRRPSPDLPQSRINRRGPCRPRPPSTALRARRSQSLA